MMSRAALVTVSAALALAGCSGGSGDPQATATVTATVTVTADAQGDTVAPGDVVSEAAVGDRALAVGEWREAPGIRSRVISVAQPRDGLMPGYLEDVGAAWGAALQVRVCLRDSVTQSVSADDLVWTARDSVGAVYEEASSTWAEWPPLPQFPTRRKLTAGDCIEGSILISTQPDATIERVELGDGEGGVSAEWIVE